MAFYIQYPLDYIGDKFECTACRKKFHTNNKNVYENDIIRDNCPFCGEPIEGVKQVVYCDECVKANTCKKWESRPIDGCFEGISNKENNK